MSVIKGVASLSMTDASLNKYTKNLPNVNPAYLPIYGQDVAESDVAKVKTACLAIMDLSQDSVNSLKLSVEMDITNIEGGDQNG